MTDEKPEKEMPVIPSEGSVILCKVPSEYNRSILNTLQKKEDFKVLYNHFSQQGLRFITERVKSVVYAMHPSSGQGGISGPVMLIIVPSFKPFKPESPSHTAVSLVSLQYGDETSHTIAVEVLVSHRPWRVENFTLHTTDMNGNIISVNIERELLEKGSEKDIVKYISETLESSSTMAKGVKILPVLSPRNSVEVATTVFKELVTDRYAKHLYPPDGLSELLRDDNIVAKFASSGVMLAKKRLPICSSSTSCNGCTSTSTSIIPISIPQPRVGEPPVEA